MANRYISEGGIIGTTEKPSTPETLYVDHQGDQRTRPIMCATEFSNTGIHKKKSTSFQITSVTVQGSRLNNDGGEDSADDLDESHTEDISSDILDCSKTTDLDNDPLSSDNSNATLDDLNVSSKHFIPAKVLTSDSDTFGASDSPGQSMDNTVADLDVTLTANTTTALPVITTQVPIVNALPEHLQQRFKVVKIVNTEPFKRGRWLCMDFTDPPTIHSEPKQELIETTDMTHTNSLINTASSENPPPVAQFYEFPVAQINISNTPQQPIPQSVYGILLPVSNSTGQTVTKVQNVGVQATCTLPVDSMNQQTVAALPIATQSQATQVTISNPSAPVTQPQHGQVAPNSAQNQTILPATQGIYSLASQTSQPNQVLPTTQGMTTALHQQMVSATQQSINLTHQAQPTTGISTIPSSQILPVTQTSQVIPGQQQHGVLSHVQTVVQPNPNLTTALPSQGIAVPSTHVTAGSQSAQGISLPQSSQGLPITQGNQNLPATQGLSIPASQGVLSNVPQMIPINQPTQMLPMNLPVAAVPIQATQVLQDLPTIQPTVNVAGAQTNQMIPVTQPSQVLQNLTQMTNLPIQLPITHASQVVPGTQANTGLSVTQQTISMNQPAILPVTQSTTSLSATQTCIPPADLSVGGASGVCPASVNTDATTSSQALNKALPTAQPPQLVNENEAQSAANLASISARLPDVLTDPLTTKAALPDGEEAESVSTGTNTVAIDNKIEQAMDLVKSHLMFAVREEVDVLKEKITELMDKISLLEQENGILKANATPEMLSQLNSENSGTVTQPSNPQQQTPAMHEHP